MIKSDTALKKLTIIYSSFGGKGPEWSILDIFIPPWSIGLELTQVNLFNTFLHEGERADKY